MPLFHCKICLQKRMLWKPLCQRCQVLFEVVQKNLGQMGFSQLLDELIATQIDKNHIKSFLESNHSGQGSILDQITASLTNNLAEGIGVKKVNLSARDVEKIRTNPTGAVSQKPLDQ